MVNVAAQRLFLASRAFALSGGALAGVLLPLLVVVVYEGGVGQVAGVLLARQGVSLLLRYPIAVWLDGHDDQLTVLVAAQLGVAVSLAAVPALWAAGWLNYPVLLVAVVAVFVFETVVTTGGYAVVNGITVPGERVAYIGRLNSVTGVADVVGQSIGPALLKVLAAPVALLAGTALNVASAGLMAVMHIRRAARGEVVAARRGVGLTWSAGGRGLRSCVRVVGSQAHVWLLWALAAGGALTAPVFIIYVVRVLAVDPELVGVLTACGAVGGVAGGLAVSALNRAVEVRTLIGLCALGSAAAVPALMFGEVYPPGLYAGVAVYEALTAFAGTVAVSVAFGRLQEDTDHERISQVMSVARIGTDALLVVALMVGGTLGEVVGPKGVLAVTFTVLMLVGVVALILANNAARTSPDELAGV